MTDANANAAETDPAAAAAIVFCDELLGEISDENARLRDSIARIRPLLDHIQRVDLVAAINGKFIFPFPYGPPTEMEGGCDTTAKIGRIATVHFSDGIIQCHEEIDKLIIPVESSREIMAMNLSMFGGIGLSIGKHSVGFYPESSPRKATAVRLTEDDEAELSVCISESICIKGNICLKQTSTSVVVLISFHSLIYSSNLFIKVS